VNPLDATLTPCKPKVPAAAAAPMLKKMTAAHVQAGRHMMRMQPVQGMIEEDAEFEEQPHSRPNGAFLHRMRPPTRQFVQLDQQVEIDQEKSGKIEINFVQENINLDEDE